MGRVNITVFQEMGKVLKKKQKN